MRLTPNRRNVIENHAASMHSGWIVEGHVAELLAEVDALKEELAMWRPLTPDEAAKAFAEAEAVPLSEDRIKEILARATDPAEQIPNSEQAQLVVALGKATAERDRLRAAESEARKKALEEAALTADTWSGERGFVSPVDAVDLCADLAEAIRGLIEEKPQ